MFFDCYHVEFNNPFAFNADNHNTFTTSNALWWRLQFFF
jgi:hypothetical protein